MKFEDEGTNLSDGEGVLWMYTDSVNVGLDTKGFSGSDCRPRFMNRPEPSFMHS